MQIDTWINETYSITVTANSIQLNGGTWEISNINLIINGSYLKNYRIIFSNDMKQLNNETMNGFNLTLINTYYSYPDSIGSKPLIQIMNSNALFANTTITNVRSSNVSLIYAGLNSKLEFINCNITEIKESANFISIFNFSVLYIEKCTIERNRVDVLFDSQVNSNNIVKESVFSENRGQNNKTGECFHALNGTKVEVFNITFYANELSLLWGNFFICVNLSHTRFISNNLKYEYLTNLYYHCSMTIEDCHFISFSGESFIMSLVVKYYSSLTVRNSLFYNNTGGIAAGLSVQHSRAYIHNVSFVSNSAIQSSCIFVQDMGKVHVSQSTFHGDVIGPAVYALTGSDLIFQKCVFSNQSSPADSFMEIHDSRLIMIDCIIDNNRMKMKGGIVQATTSSVTVKRCHFRNNSGRYGTLFSLSRLSKLTIEDSFLQNNTGSIGGCIYSTDSTIRINYTVFDSNFAVIYGGVIAGERYNTTIQNCHFTNHSAGMGGVLYVVNGSLMAQNSVFENNISPSISGTVIYKLWTGEITLDNCLLSKNNAPGGAIWFLSLGTLRLSNTTRVSCNGCGKCLEFIDYDGDNITLFTWKFDIHFGNKYISSTDSEFLMKALGNNLIFAQKEIHWKELQFASGKTKT